MFGHKLIGNRASGVGYTINLIDTAQAAWLLSGSTEHYYDAYDNQLFCVGFQGSGSDGYINLGTNTPPF